MLKLDTLPTVSVIVPAYNAEKDIVKLIESLLELDYPKKLLEIIIVDNNSNDQTKETVKQYPVKLLEEKNIQSSYAARNKGIRNAKSEIIAFIDSDCVATPQWIKEGVNILVSESADLVGGKIEFTYSENSAAELFDSITHMQTEFNIKESAVAATANLFVKSSLFDKIGMFPYWVKSGGDGQWTGKATRNGLSLLYAPMAIVKHPARSLRALLKKKYRIGGGMAHIWIGEGRSSLKFIYSVFRIFLPSRLSSIKKIIHQRGTPEMNDRVLNIWFVSCLCNLLMGVGILTEIFGGLKQRNLK